MNGGARKDGVDGNLEGGNANSGRSSRLSREEINGDTDPSHAVPDVENHETPTRTAPYILGKLHRPRIFLRGECRVYFGEKSTQNLVTSLIWFMLTSAKKKREKIARIVKILKSHTSHFTERSHRGYPLEISRPKTFL